MSRFDYKHKLATCQNPHCVGCHICAGGLSFCEVCRGGECSLPHSCPGRELTDEEQKAICNDELGYCSGAWYDLTDTADAADYALAVQGIAV